MEMGGVKWEQYKNTTLTKKRTIETKEQAVEIQKGENHDRIDGGLNIHR